MRALVCDDNQNRHEMIRALLADRRPHWERVQSVTTAADAILALVEADPPFSEVWLDHDLHGAVDESGVPEEGTGREVARAISRLPEGRRPELVVVHSANVVGREKMAEILKAAGIPVTVKPLPNVF